MADTNLELSIKTVVAHAEDMRKAGISKAQFGDIVIELEPFLVEEAPLTESGKEARSSDPFEDADTYGEGGGYVPGFRRLRDREIE